MSRRSRFATIAAAGVLGVAAPAAAQSPSHPAHPTHPAHPGHPAHPSQPAQPSQPTQPSTSHKCAPHNVAYIASGTLVSWAAAQGPNGTWTGPITVQVTKANHHAASAKGTPVTYTLTNAKVTLGTGANPPTAGDPVKVIGKVSAVAKKCTQPGTAPTITVRKVRVRATKTSPTTTASSPTATKS